MKAGTFVIRLDSAISQKTVIRRGADKSLAFPISPKGGFQHNQNNFSWMG
jgi:hypothetical protein